MKFPAAFPPHNSGAISLYPLRFKTMVYAPSPAKLSVIYHQKCVIPKFGILPHLVAQAIRLLRPNPHLIQYGSEVDLVCY